MLYNYAGGNLIAETDENGAPQRDYIYLNGEPAALRIYGAQFGTMYYFVNDHLGTPQKIVDGTGSVVWAAAYFPFGKAQVKPEIITNNLRFPGQYSDAESGLHYNWHRYYDPETGRYITADPIGLSGGINLYAYVMNNPMNGIDIEGKHPVIIVYVALGVFVYFQNYDFANAPSSATAVLYKSDADEAYKNALFTFIGAASPRVGRGIKNKLCEVDPGKLRLPPTRDGADPFKLADQIKTYGSSKEGMPPIQVTRGADGELMINNGVTRATRIDTFNQINNTRQTVPVEIIETTNHNFSKLPTIRNP